MDDAEIVDAAAAAAEKAIFEEYDRSTVDDIDVRVRFVDGELLVEVYVDAGAETEGERAREQRVADAAMEAARRAADDLLE